MKVKLVGVLVAVAALFVWAVLWRTDTFVYGDRLTWIEAQNRSQLSSMGQAVEAELKSLNRVVANFTIENFQNDKINWKAINPYYASASFLLSGDRMEPQNVFVKANSPAATWDKGFIKSVLGSIEDLKADVKVYLKPFQDTRGARHLALIFIENQNAYALIGAGDFFQSLIDSQKGSGSSFSIVTNAGLTVGHSIPDYIGTLMKDDPVFKEAQKSGALHGSNTFRTKSREIFGMYEAIPKSNLYILSNAPLADLMRGREVLWWQLILMGVGLVSVGLGLSLQLMGAAEKKIESLTEQVETLQSFPQGATEGGPSRIVGLDPEQVHRDKVQSSMRVASAVAHELSGPLASILGYSQMILAKNPEPETVENTESILREARSARAVLDKLLGFAGEVTEEKSQIKLEGPLLQVLKDLDPLFNQKGVKIRPNFRITSALDLHVGAITRALTNILQNSVEAMERMLKKEIQIDLFEDQEGIHLNIQDSGEGIDASLINKIFDPFFTTRAFQNHMGLGLSVALGILKNHNADLKMESAKGRGTKVSILFKQQVSALASEPLFAPVINSEPIIRGPAPSPEQEPNDSGSSSPLDVNIDAMLEFPEAGQVIAIEKSNEPVSAGSSISEEPVDADAAPTIAQHPVQPEVQVDFVEPQAQLPVENRSSKLESFKVEIRRPGKRV
jgi:signal transduction histidine kinase